MHLQQEERDLDHALTVATETLRTAFPRYATLTMPEPLDLPALAQLLHPDEGLVSFFTLDDRLLLWLARRDQAPVYREVTSTRTALQTLVQRVRTSLDQTTNPALATGQVLPFDVADAARLYTLLLAPLHEHLGGVTHLFIVPDEVLLPLPFGALITQADGEAYQTLADLYEQQLAPAPSELSAYAQISWLVQAYALTVLPSAIALRALRQTERTQGSAVEPFIGFGDPALQGQGTQRGGSMLGVRGTAETGRALARMNRLPATREELLAIATVLGADPDAALYLGPQATETKVRELNTAGRLGQTRVLAFATHGLLAGEATGLTQPALVLTPPAVPSEQDDGLLSLEDILQLKLPHTDWVVLSACNTAAADSSGEGLSGLARAFFFAGARALLVSHWSVDDRATRALMTATFQLHTGTPTQAPAEMLRRGMLALMTQAAGTTTYFAHPYAWAPFFLVGEGGRDAAPTSR
jgi:CHAT domain-containing protein